MLHAALDESQIFRIDHYLEKKAVQNLLASAEALARDVVCGQYDHDGVAGSPVLDDRDDRLRVPAQIIRDAAGEVTVLMDAELARSLGR